MASRSPDNRHVATQIVVRALEVSRDNYLRKPFYYLRRLILMPNVAGAMDMCRQSHLTYMHLCDRRLLVVGLSSSARVITYAPSRVR